MISRVFAVLFCLLGWTAHGQILRDINFNYLYDPEADFSFQWKVIYQADHFEVYYQLETTDTSQQVSTYTLEWDLRNSISEKNGMAAGITSPQIENRSWKQTGKFSFVNSDANQKLLVATITSTAKKKSWCFYKNLPQKQSPFLLTETGGMHTFISRNQAVSFQGFKDQKPVIISYYNDPFPSAAPPFSVAQSKVSKTIHPDSIFTADVTSKIELSKKGLYLAQQDTSSSEGLAFRVEDDYPKLGKLESLAGPLVYICTSSEYEKLKAAGTDKKKFDQVILSVTGNSERARIFMRTYFKRVEQTNLFFTSYKEGWKTDRGLIYLIFGQPTEVYLFENREVWEYKSEESKQRFQFVKSPTIFDPENYVLVREKKFTEPYYKKVDLWRKARF